MAFSQKKTKKKKKKENTSTKQTQTLLSINCSLANNGVAALRGYFF